MTSNISIRFDDPDLASKIKIFCIQQGNKHIKDFAREALEEKYQREIKAMANKNRKD